MCNKMKTTSLSGFIVLLLAVLAEVSARAPQRDAYPEISIPRIPFGKDKSGSYHPPEANRPFNRFNQGRQQLPPRPQVEVGDEELTTLTEKLFDKESSQLQHITVNLQGKTWSSETDDVAPKPLLQVDSVALKSPTIAKLRVLFDKFVLDTHVEEVVTQDERDEETEFLNAVLATPVMQQAMSYLQEKGLVTSDPESQRQLLDTIWFTIYSRGGGIMGSSAFEHVFLSEMKDGQVIGLHNWVYYNDEERAGKIDHKGYIKKVDLGSKAVLVKTRFSHNGVMKPVNSLFIGTSPELEMALYTVCFEVRPDKDCIVSLGGQKFNIVTHTWNQRGTALIGTAYPEIL